MQPSKQTILIVGASLTDIEQLEQIIESSEWDMLHAYSSEDALELILSDDISLVLVDPAMPRIGGFEMAELAAQRDDTKHIPFIFVGDPSDIDSFYSYSVKIIHSDFLSRPVDRPILRARVEFFMGLDAERREMQSRLQQARQHMSNYQESKVAGSVVAESVEEESNLGSFIEDVPVLSVDLSAEEEIPVLPVDLSAEEEIPVLSEVV